MDPDLEWAISRAVSAATLIERAYHDGEGWTIAYGPLRAPAERRMESEGITYRADFPEHCWLVEPQDPTVVLLDAKGELLAVREIRHPGDGAWTVEWTLRFQDQPVKTA